MESIPVAPFVSPFLLQACPSSSAAVGFRRRGLTPTARLAPPSTNPPLQVEALWSSDALSYVSLEVESSEEQVAGVQRRP